MAADQETFSIALGLLLPPMNKEIVLTILNTLSVWFRYRTLWPRLVRAYKLLGRHEKNDRRECTLLPHHRLCCLCRQIVNFKDAVGSKVFILPLVKAQQLGQYRGGATYSVGHGRSKNDKRTSK